MLVVNGALDEHYEISPAELDEMELNDQRECLLDQGYEDHPFTEVCERCGLLNHFGAVLLANQWICQACYPAAQSEYQADIRTFVESHES